MVYLLGSLVVLLAALLVTVVVACRRKIGLLEELTTRLAIEAGYESSDEEWFRLELLRLREKFPSYGNRRIRREFNRLHGAESGAMISQRLTDYFLNGETGS